VDRILTTGATGRLGANVASALTERGCHVRCLVMPQDPQRKKLDDMDVEIVEADLADAEKAQDAVKGIRKVVHMAAIMDEVPEGMSNVDYFDVNTRGTFALMDAAHKHGVEKFVYTSSTAVYDVLTAKDVPVREDSPLLPHAEYGVTKVAAEAALMSMSFMHDLPLVILRPSYIMACDEVLNALGAPWNTVFGLKSAREPWCGFHVPDLKGEPWGEIERKAAENPELSFIPYGPNGKAWHWHVTDVRDVVHAVMLGLETDEIQRDIFNIAGPRPTDFEEAVRYKCRNLRTSYEEVHTEVTWRLEFDITKARDLLGYAPEYDVIRMIDDAVEFRSGKDIGVIPALV